MNLYKQTPVESFRHECFFQKVVIHCDKARLILVQNQLGQSDVIDTYVTNPDDFKLYETQAEYLAHIKLITEEGEKPFEIALTTPIDLARFECDIHNKFINIAEMIEGKELSKTVYDKNSEIDQINYLLEYDRPMDDVEPCEAVQEILQLHEEYLKSKDIELAYLYEEKIKQDDQAQMIVQGGFTKCKEIMKIEIKKLMNEILGYHLQYEWLNDCSLEQLQRIFDFDWAHEIPNFQRIKEVLTI